MRAKLSQGGWAILKQANSRPKDRWGREKNSTDKAGKRTSLVYSVEGGTQGNQ